MIKLKGLLRDLLLVSVSALIAMFVTQLNVYKQSNPQQDTEEPVSGFEKTTSGAGDHVSEQLTQIRLDMARENEALNYKINAIENALQDLTGSSIDIEFMEKQFTQRPSVEAQVVSLASSQKKDEKASAQFAKAIEAELTQIALESSRLFNIDCYASKCVMEFEHDSVVDEEIFTENVLVNGNGMFDGSFSYSINLREDGRVYTTVILDR